MVVDRVIEGKTMKSPSFPPSEKVCAVSRPHFFDKDGYITINYLL